jgi:hypothetical protein
MNALIALAALAVLSLAGEALGFKRYTPTLIVVGLLAALGLNLADWNTDLTYYHKMMLVRQLCCCVYRCYACIGSTYYATCTPLL